MLKAYKYRLYPTEAQKELLNRHFGGCRFVYNLALETKIYAYKSRGVILSVYDLQKQLTDLKKDLPWMQELDSNSLNISIKRIGTAYRNFFTGSGYPKFKKLDGHQSFEYRGTPNRVDFGRSIIKTAKIGDIKAVFSRTFSGEIRKITISKTPTGKYFASVLVNTGALSPEKHPVAHETAKGFDLGISKFLVSSDGAVVDNQRLIAGSIKRIKILHKRAQKKKQGSKNKKKAFLRLAKIHEKISNQRNDFLQKLSTKIVSDNQANTFCFESLSVKNLVKNHKLAQAISDVSWSKFIEMMKYKCDWSGKSLIQVDRFYPSTKTCSCCGNVKSEIGLGVRVYECHNCGLVIDRDENAAINIKDVAIRNYSGTDGASVPSEQQALAWAMKKELPNGKNQPHRRS